MKRISLPALLLLCAATACAPAPTNSTNTNANANGANSNSANANRSAASWTNEDVIGGDRAAWDALKRKDYAAFSDMLAPEFVDVTPEGVMDKAGAVAALKTFELTDFTLSDFKVVRIDDDAAITSYAAVAKATAGGKPLPESKWYHSTVKVLRGGKWLAVFHQETQEAAAPPAPAPTAAAAAASPAASASASPAATAAATTADVEANEKLIWDALRRKDWAAFAGYLAEDQIEVWGTGVQGKAESVKGVQNVDFSTFTMSDFKAVTIDADARIAIYTVKGTDRGRPFTEHTATVWANRGGRWLALFHQGTPVKQPGA
jgi:hypothetical protein